MINITPQKDNAICEIDLFDKKGLARAIKTMGWKESENTIVDNKGKEIDCDYCGAKLSRKNLTAFFPGSVKKVCDNPGCFLKALEDYEKK